MFVFNIQNILYSCEQLPTTIYNYRHTTYNIYTASDGIIILSTWCSLMLSVLSLFLCATCSLTRTPRRDDVPQTQQQDMCFCRIAITTKDRQQKHKHRFNAYIYLERERDKPARQRCQRPIKLYMWMNDVERSNNMFCSYSNIMLRKENIHNKTYR